MFGEIGLLTMLFEVMIGAVEIGFRIVRSVRYTG